LRPDYRQKKNIEPCIAAFGSCLSFESEIDKDTLDRILRVIELIKASVTEQIGNVSYMRAVSVLIKKIFCRIDQWPEDVVLKESRIFDMLSALLKCHFEDPVIAQNLMESLTEFEDYVSGQSLKAHERYTEWMEKGCIGKLGGKGKMWESLMKDFAAANGVCDSLVLLLRSTRADGVQVRRSAQNFIDWLMDEDTYSGPCLERLSVLLPDSDCLSSSAAASETASSIKATKCG